MFGLFNPSTLTFKVVVPFSSSFLLKKKDQSSGTGSKYIQCACDVMITAIDDRSMLIIVEML